MKKIVLFFAVFLSFSLCAMRTSQEQFEVRKSHLSTALQRFVDDFSTWPAQDRAAIKIFGLSFVVSDLGHQKQTAYKPNLGAWIDCHTTTHVQRENLIYCLACLQTRLL